MWCVEKYSKMVDLKVNSFHDKCYFLTCVDKKSEFVGMVRKSKIQVTY